MGPNPRSCLDDKVVSKLGSESHVQVWIHQEDNATVFDVIFSAKSIPSFKSDGRLQDLVVKTACEGFLIQIKVPVVNLINTL